MPGHQLGDPSCSILDDPFDPFRIHPETIWLVKVCSDDSMRSSVFASKSF